jgi:prolyl 4-hydroxylase
MVRLSASPDLWMIDGFVDADGCARLAEVARDTTRAIEAGFDATFNKTGHCQEIPIDGVPENEALRERIEALFGVQSDLYETFRYRRYGVGEGHPPHLDCYAFEGRERIATALLSLRDTAAGGETEFPAAGRAVEPRRGRLVCWYNHREDGSRDPRSRHAGLPVREGEKEVLLYFIYKPAEVAAYRPLADALESGTAPSISRRRCSTMAPRSASTTSAPCGTAMPTSGRTSGIGSTRCGRR